MITGNDLKQIRRLNRHKLNQHARKLLDAEGVHQDGLYLQLPLLMSWAIEEQKVHLDSSNEHLESWVDALLMQENAWWAWKVLVKWKGEEKFNPEEFLSLENAEEAAVFLLLVLMSELPLIAPHLFCTYDEGDTWPPPTRTPVDRPASTPGIGDQPLTKDTQLSDDDIDTLFANAKAKKQQETQVPEPQPERTPAPSPAPQPRPAPRPGLIQPPAPTPAPPEAPTTPAEGPRAIDFGYLDSLFEVKDVNAK